ncbi:MULTISPECIES: hypothetical protein [unclassified Rhizobium]|jgi:hypothetical protein|uniref:hypothetical protein n=1 Tax=unclassified Rhizobium TaxID=2613769 RepID=UPI00193D0124|nr:hypothetical protein [Rhizobium sp. BG4]QRM47569.1 hypothetical protein F2982_30260 [Rhizobium sp. BG4]
MAKDDLTTGFTGTPTEPPTGVRKVASDAVDAVRRETSAVAAGAAEHPHTATGLALTVGAIGLCIGYILGRNSAASDYDYRRYWR